MILWFCLCLLGTAKKPSCFSPKEPTTWKEISEQLLAKCSFVKGILCCACVSYRRTHNPSPAATLCGLWPGLLLTFWLMCWFCLENRVLIILLLLLYLHGIKMDLEITTKIPGSPLPKSSVAADFTRRSLRLLGLKTGSLSSHHTWYVSSAHWARSLMQEELKNNQGTYVEAWG